MASWQIFKLFRPKFSPNRTKNGQLYVVFFVIFEIDIQFRIISKLFSVLRLPNFFPNFFREFKNFGFFRKISELRKPDISETRENEKFGKNRLSQGLNWIELRCVQLIWKFADLWSVSYNLMLISCALKFMR